MQTETEKKDEKENAFPQLIAAGKQLAAAWLRGVQTQACVRERTEPQRDWEWEREGQTIQKKREGLCS